MESLETIITRAALGMQLAEEDLRVIFGQGEQKTYEAGDWLFHESTPRDWAGIVQAGEIDIVRGLHGSPTRLARLGPGAMIAEGALLDTTPHTTGAFTREGAVVWQIPRAVWEEAELVRQCSTGW
jgi:aspartate ammonia-lyase